MDRGGGGGVTYANRNGRQDYDDRHADNGGHHSYNSHSSDSNGGSYRRNPVPGYNTAPSGGAGAGAGGGYNSGRGGASWGQFSGSNGRPRNDSAQYPDRPSNVASSSSIPGGSPPNSHGYDGPGRGEHRNYGDSSYRGQGNNSGSNDGRPDPSESLKAYQQSKSSDPYAVGLGSTAAFFHETYDKLERPGGFADSTAGTQFTVTVIKTYREMATQTTEDQTSGSQDSTWNGVRIISSGKQQPTPQHPPQHQHQQQQQQQQRAAQAYPKAPIAPVVAAPPRSTATVTSLLNAVLTPSQSPVVSSATALKPNASGSYGASVQYSSDERRPHGMTGSSSGGLKSNDNAPTVSSAYQKPPYATSSSANKPLATSDNSSWMAAPDSDTKRSTTTTQQDNTRNEMTKKADPRGALPPAAASVKGDPWSQPAAESTAKADPWAQTTSTSNSRAESGFSGWGNTSQGKAVSDLVDWSTGLVSEFPTEAKPTFMAVTERWDRMDKYDPSYTNNRQKAQQQQQQQQQQPPPPPPQQQQQQQQQQKQQQLQSSHSDSKGEENKDHHRDRGRAQEKQEVVQQQGGSDPWFNDGNAGLSDWGSSEPGESQMIFMDRDDASSQGQPPQSSEQEHHQEPARHHNDDDGHYPSTGASQDRRAMTSEERFNNSYNRPSSGGGGGMGGSANGRYNSNSRGGPGPRYGDGSSGTGGGGHGYERAQRHGPMTVTPSSPVGITGRRYFNNTIDRDSALGAWSAASQNASSKPGPGQGVPPSGSSTSLPGSGATEGSVLVKSSGSTMSSSGRPALATASDFGSFFQAAAMFIPSPARARQGSQMRRGSESESTTTHHSSPSRSRESSRSRPPYSGTTLEHTEEEPERTEEIVEHNSFPAGHEQVDKGEDLIKDEEITPVVVPSAGTGTVVEEDKGDKQQETAEEDDDRKEVVRMNSNSSRTSSQAMEDNLLTFQMQKQAVVGGSGDKEKEEEQEEKKQEEEVVDGPGAIEVEKVVSGSTQGSPKANSDDE